MLTYIVTQSIEDFKRSLGQDTIDVKVNSRTGKTFFSCGNQTGAVSSKLIENDFADAVVSQCESSDTGEVFYMLHGRNEGGATRLARL